MAIVATNTDVAQRIAPKIVHPIALKIGRAGRPAGGRGYGLYDVRARAEEILETSIEVRDTQRDGVLRPIVQEQGLGAEPARGVGRGVRRAGDAEFLDFTDGLLKFAGSAGQTLVGGPVAQPFDIVRLVIGPPRVGRRQEAKVSNH